MHSCRLVPSNSSLDLIDWKPLTDQPPRNGAIGLFKPTIQKCASTVIRQSMAMEAQACMSYSLSPRWTYAG